jgi:hypothetical protein
MGIPLFYGSLELLETICGVTFGALKKALGHAARERVRTYTDVTSNADLLRRYSCDMFDCFWRILLQKSVAADNPGGMLLSKALSARGPRSLCTYLKPRKRLIPEWKLSKRRSHREARSESLWSTTMRIS